MDGQPIFLIFPERQMPVDADMKSVSQKTNAASWKYAKPFVKWAGGKNQSSNVFNFSNFRKIWSLGSSNSSKCRFSS